MSLDLKQRDKGSTSVGQKAKSLVARWFTKIDVKELLKRQLPPGISTTTALLGPLSPRIERDVIVRVNRKGSAVAEDFAVLAVFNKHYNKWLMLADDFPEWKRKKAAEETVGGTAVTARRITNSATTKATTTSESGTGNNTGIGSSKKKKRKKNKKEEKYRLLLRMLIYDGEMRNRCDWSTCLYKYALAMNRYVVRRYIKRSS
jgi:hypothetical protein